MQGGADLTGAAEGGVSRGIAPGTLFGPGAQDNMTLSLQEFFSELFTNLSFSLTVLLTTVLILVNGLTDLPNSFDT